MGEEKFVLRASVVFTGRSCSLLSMELVLVFPRAFPRVMGVVNVGRA